MINIYCTALTANKVKGFGCHFKNSSKVTTFTIPSDGLTRNQLDLNAVKYALMSVLDNNTVVEIVTSNKYVADMLERNDGGWVKNASSNTELVVDIRDLADDFENVTFKYDRNDPRLKDLEPLCAEWEQT